MSSLLSDDLMSETSSRIDSDKAISGAFKNFVDVDFAQHVQDFDDHVQENKETFDFLSN